MKIISFSDTHGLHESITIPKCDIAICCGDVTGNGTLQHLESFIYWYTNVDANYKILIAGNHDWCLDNDFRYISKSILSGTQIIYLEDDSIELEGINIYGTPYQPIFRNWAFNLEEKSLKKKWDIIHKCDILVTHCPSKGILDRTVDGKYCGSNSLLNRVEQLKPKYHLFGHIHEAYGKRYYNKTEFINSSVLDHRYRICNNPVEIKYGEHCE